MIYWDALGSLSGNSLYEAILGVFLDKCFSPELIENNKEHLLKLFPKFGKHIHDNMYTTKTSKFCHEEAYRSGLEKYKHDDEIALVVESIYIILLHFHPKSRMQLCGNLQLFSQTYPEFSGVNQDEIIKLLLFRNVMVLALLIIPARLRKTRLMEIASRLSEGRHKRYCCGGGQSEAVNRRVHIYEKEGGVKKIPRAPRWNEIVAVLNAAVTHSNANGEEKKGRKLSSPPPYHGNSYGGSVPPSKFVRMISESSREQVQSCSFGAVQVERNTVTSVDHHIVATYSSISADTFDMDICAPVHELIQKVVVTSENNENLLHPSSGSLSVEDENFECVNLLFESGLLTEHDDNVIVNGVNVFEDVNERCASPVVITCDKSTISITRSASHLNQQGHCGPNDFLNGGSSFSRLDNGHAGFKISNGYSCLSFTDMHQPSFTNLVDDHASVEKEFAVDTNIDWETILSLHRNGDVK